MKIMAGSGEENEDNGWQRRTMKIMADSQEQNEDTGWQQRRE